MRSARVLVRTIYLFLALTVFLSGCLPGDNSSDKLSGAVDSKKGLKERVSLRWTVAAPPNVSLPSREKDFVRKTIEEKFNVELKIDYLTIGPNHTNQLSMKLASGDAPDLFITGGVGSLKYVQDKVAADMDEYVTPVKMPNYFKWVSETELKRSGIEGRFSRAPLPFNRRLYPSYYIRKDWLDNLGMGIPRNYDEMLHVMRQFRHGDPDGNGRKDTYGFSASGDGDTVPFDFPQHYNQGLIPGISVEDGILYLSGTDIRLGHALRDIQALLKEDIVDPEWFLNRGTQYLDKAVQGKVGIVMSSDPSFALEGVHTSYQNKAKAVHTKADWRPFHPWSQTGTTTENLPSTFFLFHATTAKNNPERIERTVQILNWLAGEEGFLLTHYGVEGRHYTRSGTQIRLKPDELQKDVFEHGDFLQLYAFFTPDTPDVLGLTVINPDLSERDREIVRTLLSYRILPSVGTNVAPPPGFPLNDFSKRRKELTVLALFEDGNPAQTWPEYRELLMSEYRGKQLLEGYAEQISKALGIPVRTE